eukprot:173035-Chlamydomonas_euryale.AAC.2
MSPMPPCRNHPRRPCRKSHPPLSPMSYAASAYVVCHRRQCRPCRNVASTHVARAAMAHMPHRQLERLLP